MNKKNSIFYTHSEISEGAYFEFRYNWQNKCALYIPISKDQVFFKEYLKYLEPTKTPDGNTKFDACGINYYTKEQAEKMLNRIKADKPKEYTVLLSWLDKFISESSENGFYILGV